MSGVLLYNSLKLNRCQLCYIELATYNVVKRTSVQPVMDSCETVNSALNSVFSHVIIVNCVINSCIEVLQECSPIT